MKKESLKEIIKSPYFTFGVLTLLGFFVLGIFFKSGLSNISVLTNAQGISVSGTSERFVTSDKGSLTINLKTDTKSTTDISASKNLKEARENIIKYLTSNDIDEKDMDVSPVTTSEECTLRDKDNWENCLGKKYNTYYQNLYISSNNVEKIKDLSSNINNYIDTSNTNTSLSIQNVQYFYSEFSNIKSEMLNEATKNAFERAEAIAKSTNNHAGEVITASQGVFQVTSKDSVDSQDYGSYDTSTIEKKITAVVRVSFKVK